MRLWLELGHVRGAWDMSGEGGVHLEGLGHIGWHWGSDGGADMHGCMPVTKPVPMQNGVWGVAFPVWPGHVMKGWGT